MKITIVNKETGQGVPNVQVTRYANGSSIPYEKPKLTNGNGEVHFDNVRMLDHFTIQHNCFYPANQTVTNPDKPLIIPITLNGKCKGDNTPVGGTDLLNDPDEGYGTGGTHPTGGQGSHTGTGGTHPTGGQGNHTGTGGTHPIGGQGNGTTGGTKPPQNTFKMKFTVIDQSTRQSLPGAEVLNTAIQQGAVADMNGLVVIDAAPDDVLLIKFLGYKDKQVKARNIQNTVALVPDPEQLDTVTVTVPRKKKPWLWIVLGAAALWALSGGKKGMNGPEAGDEQAPVEVDL